MFGFITKIITKKMFYLDYLGMNFFDHPWLNIDKYNPKNSIEEETYKNQITSISLGSLSTQKNNILNFCTNHKSDINIIDNYIDNNLLYSYNNDYPDNIIDNSDYVINDDDDDEFIFKMELDEK